MDHRPDEITLELDRIKLTLSPRLGGAVTSLMIRDPNSIHEQPDWTPVFRTMPTDAPNASAAGSFVMLPWTNRIKDAKFSHAGELFELMPNSSDNSAIHGVGRGLPWAITDRSPITARLVLDTRSFDPEMINYPFAFGAVQRFEIGPNSVEIDLSITNLDSRPIPVGCGHHPYIHRHLFSPEDELRVGLETTGRYPTQGCIPTGEPIFDSVCKGFKDANPIGNPRLDDVFAGFAGTATFDWPTSNVRMTMKCSKNLGHVVIYTPTGDAGSPSEYVCVEPVSMVNDGFNQVDQGNADTGVVTLKPNETMNTRLRIEFDVCKSN